MSTFFDTSDLTQRFANFGLVSGSIGVKQDWRTVVAVGDPNLRGNSCRSVIPKCLVDVVNDVVGLFLVRPPDGANPMTTGS